MEILRGQNLLLNKFQYIDNIPKILIFKHNQSHHQILKKCHLPCYCHLVKNQNIMSTMEGTGNDRE